MNAMVRRSQRSIYGILGGTCGSEQGGGVGASPTARTKRAKVPISELILRQCTMDNKPIFLSATKKYNSTFYEACFIKLYTKQGMVFGDCPDVYLVHSFPEAKDEIYKAFEPFYVEATQG